MGFPFFIYFGELMIYKKLYNSPLGEILILGDLEGILGIYFECQREFYDFLNNEEIKNFEDAKNFELKDKNFKSKSLFHEKNKVSGEDICENKIFDETKKWLDIYFSRKEPKFTPKLNIRGSEFRKDVWKILLEIPYGKTLTYKAVAEKLVESKKYVRMSAQAVGGAVGANPISIIIPCHRVVGASGSLTGYAGGLDRKVKLLELEGVDMSKFFMPKKYK